MKCFEHLNVCCIFSSFIFSSYLEGYALMATCPFISVKNGYLSVVSCVVLGVLQFGESIGKKRLKLLSYAFLRHTKQHNWVEDGRIDG